MHTNETFHNLEVDINTLPKAEEQSYHPLEPTFVYVLIIETILTWLLILGLSWFIYLILEDFGYLKLFGFISLGIAVALIVNLTWLKRACSKRGYAVRDKDLTYKRGIILSRQITIPFNKIQQVVVSQNIIFRIVGLYSLNIRTAAQTSDGVNIVGLTREQAESLKEMIMSKIS
ncbi:PH domain-containing protein [Porphyromonas sp.]|uniref:PH domain-containing protein n=1 Tax=Porphyromonas sp. TaxID=1924944 RepID=UPI0026DDC33C|nr:PH domain-containing protein [Porphyromonas sp.]MDO4770579.1 PH domain-containing protein [Porphyromonas sp.]